VDWVVLEREARARHIDAIAEVAPYYAGIAPDDARLEPMWKLAEERSPFAENIFSTEFPDGITGLFRDR
jgi:hypothetical protein